MTADPKCNQQGTASTFGWPSAADVAEQQQAKFAAHRAEQRRAEEATARAKEQQAKDASDRAAETREASRLRFWHD